MMSRVGPSAEIKQSFDYDGFVTVRSFLNPLELEQVQKRMETYVRDILPYVPRTHAHYEDKDRPETLKHLLELSKYDVFFARMNASEKFIGLAELLLDGPVRLSCPQWFNKPPRLGQATPPHQDGYYFM